MPLYRTTAFQLFVHYGSLSYFKFSPLVSCLAHKGSYNLGTPTVIYCAPVCLGMPLSACSTSRTLTAIQVHRHKGEAI